MKYLTNSGLSYFFNKIKAYIASQLNSKANLTHTHSASDITSGLATVATSGSYNDLSNKPTIPTVNNATLTIQKNGTTVKTFTANASSNVTANITVPTKTSELTNDSGFLTSHQDLSGYVPRNGGAVISGESIGKTNNTSRLIICGGTDVNNGGSISVYGKDSSSTGDVTIQSNDGTNIHQLRLNSNGTATWNRKNLAMQEDVIPRSGGAVLSGQTYSRTVDNSILAINGSSTDENGAFLRLHGKDYGDTPFAGSVFIRANNGSNACNMLLRPDGTATWGSKNIAMQEDTVPRSGGAVLTGDTLARTTNNGWLALCGGTYLDNGCMVHVTGKDHKGAAGRIYLRALKSSTEQKDMLIYSSGTWTWNGTACQIASDQRLKQQITEIDDKLLDAWEDVSLVQFKYNDAVDQKGKDKARLHTGYVVQQIDKACQSHGVDISQYGLYCHEEYPEETEEVEVEQADGTKVKETKVIREASEHYSLRYTETLVVECAYLRKRIKELEERLEKLEGNSK